MDESKSSSRTDRYKAAIKETILSLLSATRVRELRAEYASGKESIADLSQRTGVPPSCYGHSLLHSTKKLILNTNSYVWKRRSVPCGQRESH